MTTEKDSDHGPSAGGAPLLAPTPARPIGIAWLWLAGVLAVASYASVLIPPLFGQPSWPGGAPAATIFSAVLFFLMWRRRGPMAWRGALVGVAVALAVLIVAGFFWGYVRARVGH